jgi:GntR family transcriptional repressor for pyruvate dehydrogenase complex
MDQNKSEPGEIPSKRVADIANGLSLSIRNGSLAVGSKLPTEKMLCVQFGVSRTLVREAISRIKADGLVESFQGSGVFFSQPFNRKSIKFDESYVADTKRILSLFELREPIEIAAVRLAAARRTDSNLERLSAAHDELLGADSKSAESVTADLNFHFAIAQATQNIFYSDFMAFLGGVIRASIRTARAKSDEPNITAITIEEHARIKFAIENQDPEKAALAMHLHLEGARKRMKNHKFV